jgi:hypothetical protein
VRIPVAVSAASQLRIEDAAQRVPEQVNANTASVITVLTRFSDELNKSTSDVQHGIVGIRLLAVLLLRERH